MSDIVSGAISSASSAHIARRVCSILRSKIAFGILGTFLTYTTPSTLWRFTLYVEQNSTVNKLYTILLNIARRQVELEIKRFFRRCSDCVIEWPIAIQPTM